MTLIGTIVHWLKWEVTGHTGYDHGRDSILSFGYIQGGDFKRVNKT